MRFHAIGNPRARLAADCGLTRTALRGRTVTLGLLAVATCALAMTACGSQNPPGMASSSTSAAASPAGTPTSPGFARRYANVAGFARRYANVAGFACRHANVAGFACRYANVAGFACRHAKAAVSRRCLCHS